MANGLLSSLSGNALVLDGIEDVQAQLTSLDKEVKTLIRQNRILVTQNEMLIRQGARIMAGITEENAAIQTLSDNFTKFAEDVQKQVTGLKAALAAGTDTQPFIDKLTTISKAITDADGALNPAPVVVPAP